MKRTAWPRWLEDIYGPAPRGPQRRAAALAEHSRRRREIAAQLADTAPHASGRPVSADPPSPATSRET